MVTTVPGKPLSGVILVIRGLLIVKGMELLQTPFCRICALPELEPDATVVITCPSLQLTTCPGATPSQTLPLPWVAPKPDPAIVTCVPATPEFGDTLEITGYVITVKFKPLLATPPTVTTTLPVVAPVGTRPTIRVTLQLAGVTVVPLKLTVLDPWVEPKLEPVIVTCVPATPEPGDTLVITAGVVTVKFAPLLSTPLACTTRLPVLAPLGTGTTI